MSLTVNEGRTKNLSRKLVEELKSLGLVALFFGCWLAVFLLIKRLLLEEYQIQFSGFSVALVGALVLSKVVLILEHVPLGAWVRSRPAWVDVVVRTAMYSLGVLVVLLLEKGFDGRYEYHGFGPSLRAVFQHADVYHVWVNSICLSGALLIYNLLTVVRRRLGKGELLRMFMTPMPEEIEKG